MKLNNIKLSARPEAKRVFARCYRIEKKIYIKDSKFAAIKQLMWFTDVYRESNSESTCFLSFTSKFENHTCWSLNKSYFLPCLAFRIISEMHFNRTLMSVQQWGKSIWLSTGLRNLVLLKSLPLIHTVAVFSCFFLILISCTPDREFTFFS